MTTMKPPSYKRSRSFWEPVFEPNLATPEFKVFDWDTHVTGFEFGHCNGEDLALKARGERYKISTFNFSSCDFKGDFSFCKMTFHGCTFVNCDFQDSLWKLTKFANCSFKRCSFSTSNFESVQFLDCQWSEIGMSSGEMRLTDVLISNPDEFIASAYTNTDAPTLAQNRTTPAYQTFRLEGTKAKIARTVLTSLQGQYDDLAYYKAVKTYARQSLISRIVSARFESLSTGVFKKSWKSLLALALTIELWILSISGLVNDWGRSIGRASLVGLGLVTAFFVVYQLMHAHAGDSNWLAAIEITLLFGYTKYASVQDSLCIQMLECFNAVLGLWWYAIFVPTVVNRISRIRA